MILGASVALAAPAALAAPLPALAYEGCESESSITASVAEAVAGVSFRLDAEVRDCTGFGVEGASVVFGTQSAPTATCQASFNPGQAATDSAGLATSQATLPPGCPCVFVLGAHVPTSSGGFTLSTPVREAGCLPFTAAAAAQVPAAASTGVPRAAFSAAVGLVVLLIAGAGAVAIRRRF